MSRISSTFRSALKKNSKVFIPYIMAGDPSLVRTMEVLKILEDCGADIIELGIPFSDPLADGPTIQKAAQRALDNGVRLGNVIEFVHKARDTVRMPIIFMTYFNPVFKYGVRAFVRDASAAGVDGVIIPDLLPDEAGELMAAARQHSFDTIFLLAPTSPKARIRKVAKASSGFIYYVSVTGITGARLTLDPGLATHITEIRKKTKTPVAVGFGIATPEDAARISGLADGVIVGSAIVARIAGPDHELSAYLKSLRAAIS